MKNKIFLLTLLGVTTLSLTACQTGQLASIKESSNTIKQTQLSQSSVNSNQSKGDCHLNGIDYGDIEGSTSLSVWQTLYNGCSGSVVVTYNYAKLLVHNNQIEQAKNIINSGLKQFPSFSLLKELQQAIQSPFTRVAQIANKKLEAWIKRPSQIASFNKQIPNKEKSPSLPTLVKGEFETTTDFKKRVKKAQNKREAQIKSIEQVYNIAVADFNKSVSRHNVRLKQEQQKRQAKIPAMRRQFLAQAMAEVFGNPKFINAKYDADNQTFYAQLTSSNGNFDKKVTIKVPLSQAKSFKQNLSQVEPQLSFDIVNDKIELDDISSKYRNTNYITQLTDEIYESIPVSVQIAASNIAQSHNISLLTPDKLNTSTLLAENKEHFKSALTLENDPKLAKQRQKLAEIKRKKREAQRRHLIEQERLRLAEQIKKQQQELVSMGGAAADEYKGLKLKTAWNFKPAKVVKREMVAVVIGNRNYQKGIPLVHYAHNDAKAVKQFLLKSYALTPENILYEEDATKGTMDGIFKKRLRNRVEAGHTDVFVYFSGHGMPVGDDARLLPSDSRPETADINGYSRDEMLQQLASLNAKSLTVVLDSCYSGSSKDGKALQTVKAIMAEPKRLSTPKNAVVISAASGRQTAFMDDKSGHSLLTYYLLKGLSGKADQNNNQTITTTELRQYLSSQVSRSAVLLHEQNQQPQVKGDERELIRF